MRMTSITQKFKIHGAQGDLKGFLHLSNNPDGTLAEVEIDIHREGTMSRAMAHAFTSALNMGLKKGVDLEAFVSEFLDWRFEPAGLVEGSLNVHSCTSILDYVAQEIRATYLKKEGVA